jgi:NADP-dependent 3-hydroxy acid dehydrogenase YdfG
MPEALSSPLGTAVVTGASAGIGAATARYLRSAGFDVVIGARRMDRLNEVADGIGARALPLDVTDPASVEAFTSAVESCSVLVNNAGGALGLDRVADSSDEQWSEMYERNVLSILRMTRALLPKLIASGNGRIVNIGSVAGFHVYEGGGGYEQVTPLSAEDIADCVTWAVTRPPHVNVDEVVVTARAQVLGFGQQIHRE